MPTLLDAQHRLDELRRLIRRLADASTGGAFDEETGEPLDEVARAESLLRLLDDEYLAPAAELLEQLRRRRASRDGDGR